MLPKIVIVGRPNVGKSSLLNLLAGRLVSIVAPNPGVTRDRISTVVELPVSLGASRRPSDATGPADPLRPWVEVIDTGGYGIEDSQNLTAEVEHQIALGLAEADVVLFVVDAQTGIVSLDREAARMLRRELGERKKKQDSRKAGQHEIGAEGGATRLAPAATRGSSGGGKALADKLPVAPGEAPSPQPSPSEGRGGMTNRVPPVILVANKVDSERYEAGAAEASRLGFGPPLPVSAVSGFNEDLLLEAIRANLPPPTSGGPGGQDAALGMLLAVVGKRNAGKSTLVNALAGEERMIVSELEGTTRDAVDVRFERDGRVFTAIDTAGVRKTKSLQGDVEFYSQHRALRAVRRAHVVLLLLDATIPVSHVDQQIAHEVAEHFKPCIVVVNKWDLAQAAIAKGKTTQEEFVKYLDKELGGLNYAPLAFISAKNGEGMKELINEALDLYEQAGQRVPTAALNRAVEEAMSGKAPSSGIGRRARVYYMTQLSVHPPTIALFVNDPTMFDAAYQRYLLNRFRETLPFAEVPIKLVIRGRENERERGPEPKKPRPQSNPWSSPQSSPQNSPHSAQTSAKADAEATRESPKERRVKRGKGRDGGGKR